MFIASAVYIEEIRRLIERSDKVDMAVAFWGKGAEDLLPSQTNQRVRIVCNLASGGTNPDPIRSLLKRNYDVKQLHNLHAKVVIGNGIAIVGSANHSTNGLQLEGPTSNGWSEAGLLSDDPKDLAAISDWFESEWERARPISKEDLDAAEVAWRARFANRPLRAVASFSELRRSDLLGRQIYGVIWSESPSPEAAQVYEAAVANAKESGQANASFLDNLSYFENWNSLPSGVPLVSFQALSNGKYRCDGVWRRLDKNEKKVLKNRKGGPQLQFVLQEKTLFGLHISDKDEKKLAKMLESRAEVMSEQRMDGSGIIFPIHELFSDP
jgi:hypothetical protein